MKLRESLFEYQVKMKELKKMQVIRKLLWQLIPNWHRVPKMTMQLAPKQSYQVLLSYL